MTSLAFTLLAHFLLVQTWSVSSIQSEHHRSFPRPSISLLLRFSDESHYHSVHILWWEAEIDHATIAFGSEQEASNTISASPLELDYTFTHCKYSVSLNITPASYVMDLLKYRSMLGPFTQLPIVHLLPTHPDTHWRPTTSRRQATPSHLLVSAMRSSIDPAHHSPESLPSETEQHHIECDMTQCVPTDQTNKTSQVQINTLTIELVSEHT